ANESQPDNKKIVADLGSSFFLRGDKQKANQLWEKILDKEASIDDYRLYLQTLSKQNLNEQARKRLTPLLIARLREDFKRLIREVAESFGKTDAKAKFFGQLCAAARENRFLPTFLIQQSLVSR